MIFGFAVSQLVLIQMFRVSFYLVVPVEAVLQGLQAALRLQIPCWKNPVYYMCLCC